MPSPSDAARGSPSWPPATNCALPGEDPSDPARFTRATASCLPRWRPVSGPAVTVLERARDDRADLDAKIAAGLGAHDALVVAGGVSVGERDFVKERLAAAGVGLDLWRVRVQPGKPFLYGRGGGERGNTHVFGLPGNPVSVVCDVSPLRAAGVVAHGGRVRTSRWRCRCSRPRRRSELVNRGDRPHYLRGTLDGHARSFAPAGPQQSHALFALSRSRALVRVEPETVPSLRVRAWTPCSGKPVDRSVLSKSSQVA